MMGIAKVDLYLSARIYRSTIYSATQVLFLCIRTRSYESPNTPLNIYAVKRGLSASEVFLKYAKEMSRYMDIFDKSFFTVVFN